MKRLYILLLIWVCLISKKNSEAQNIGINATGDAPDNSAILDISATDKGLLVPRVALTAMNSNAPIGASISNSLLVYNTATAGISPNNVTPGYYWWNADEAKWVRLVSSEDIPAYNAGTGLSLSGTTFNSVWTTNGNNIYNNNTDRVGIGTTTPTKKLHVVGESFGVAVVDQQNTTATNAVLLDNFWQSFTAGVSGLLTSIDLYRTGPSSNSISSVLNIYEGEGTGGVLLWSGSVTVPASSGVFNLSVSGSVVLTAGQKYTMQMSSSESWYFVYTSYNSYAGGISSLVSTHDLNFRTYIAPFQSALRIEDGNQASGKVLTSDADGNATWQTPIDNSTTYTAGTGLSLSGTTFNSVWTVDGNNIYNNNAANVGIGTSAPYSSLDVLGNIYTSVHGNSYLHNAAEQVSRFIGHKSGNTSDGFAGMEIEVGAFGGAGGVTPNASKIHFITWGNSIASSRRIITIDPNGRMGIGTTAPTQKLDIDGQIRIRGGAPGNGKILTSDAAGVATWQTPYNGGTLNDAYNFGGAGAGRIITASSGPVNIEGTSGFQVTGTLNSGAVLNLSGAGTRMFFNPRKAAFRAGYVSGAKWNVDSVGTFSFAGGYDSKASGLYSTAFGYETSATGQGSSAFGANTIASGADATAMGVLTSASGRGATSMGGNTSAPSYFETALGIHNTTYAFSSSSTWNANDRLLVLGNGQSAATRSNAMVILKNGNTVIGNGEVPKGRLEINNNVQTQASLVLSGQEYQVPNTNTESGIALLLGVNRPNNKQLWITDQSSVNSPNSTNPVIRIAPNGTFGVGLIDAMATNGMTSLPLILQQSGNNVGIGTTNPTQKLDIDGQIRIRGGVPGLGKILTSDANGVGTWQTPTDNNTTYTAGLGMSLSGTTFNSVWTANGNNIYHNNSGNVGFGVTGPTQKLDINGQIRIRGGAPGNGKILTSDANGVGTWQTPNFGVTLNNAYNFGGAGAGRIIYANSGPVEINKTTQRQANLVLSGQEYYESGHSDAGIAIMAGVNRSGNKQLWITDQNYVATPNAIRPVIRLMLPSNSTGVIDAIATDGTTLLPLILQGGGNRVGIGRIPVTNVLEINGNASKTTAGDWLANSDQRLKKNIQTIPSNDALEKILQLRGVTYEWNDDKTGYQRPSGLQIGFIAQEIQNVFPEKVIEDADGYLQTAYGDYDPLYVQAFKELVNEIESLKSQLAEMSARVDTCQDVEIRMSVLEKMLTQLLSQEKITSITNVND